jgi:hypothetical protein
MANTTCMVLDPNYNPNPTRIGYRSNNCEFIYDNIQESIVNPEERDILQQQHKGNILQYKHNSTNYSKNIMYSKIIQGKWSNRKKCYASQSVKYTNPNIHFFARSGNTNILLNGTATNEPLTCPPYSNLVYYNSNQRSNPSNGVIPNGGVFVCNKQENICTGYSKTINNPPNCFSTYCSDIPGKERFICYKKTINPYYPKPKRVMTSSGNKFPTNYKPLPCSSANSIPSQSTSCV